MTNAPPDGPPWGEVTEVDTHAKTVTLRPFVNLAFCSPREWCHLYANWEHIVHQLHGIGIHTLRPRLCNDIHCEDGRCYLFDRDGQLHTFVILPHEGLAPETVTYAT